MTQLLFTRCSVRRVALVALPVSLVAIWAVCALSHNESYGLLSVLATKILRRGYTPGFTSDKGRPTIERYLTGRYSVEILFKQYLQYVRGELEYIMDKGKYDPEVFDELFTLTRDISSISGSHSHVTEEGTKQIILSARQGIYDALLLAKRGPVKSPLLDRLIEDTVNLESLLKNNVDLLSRTSGEWKEETSSKLGSLIQKKIDVLQNPTDCQRARLLHCKWDELCRSGFGCQMHHVTYCLIMAFSLNRTLVFDSKGWPYPGTLDTWFRPLSTCTEAKGRATKWGVGSTTASNNAHIISIPRLGNLKPRPDIVPLAIPDGIADDILRFHRFPPAWWIGQFINYILRPNPMLARLLDDHANAIGFKYPIVGVHVRRTDKLNDEAKAIPLDRYMSYVSKWYDHLEMRSPNVTRMVFLATDEQTVAKEAMKKYPEYNMIQTGEQMNAKTSQRTSRDGIRSIILDLLLLSRTNYTVCTHSSNVCRAVYELMQHHQGDGSNLVKSLDEMYKFDMHLRDNHTVEVVVPHAAIRPDEHDLAIGDQIHMQDNHWNGFSSGIIRKSGRKVYFPSYKVKDIFRRVKVAV